MAKDRTHEPVPPDIAEFLTFFEDSLGALQFPDVDRESLRALADGVCERARELEALEAQARAAREALEEAHATLRRAAQRGLAYATVYADGDPELSERIAALSLGKPAGKNSGESKSPTRTRGGGRGRKAKEGAGARSGNGGKADKVEPTAELPFANGRDATDALDAAPGAA